MYKENTGRTDLVATLELLGITSKLVENFSDNRPVRSIEDKRLSENSEALDWLVEWEGQYRADKNSFITMECYNDMLSMLMGTLEVIKIKLSEYPLSAVYLHRMNSDIVENVFSSQRGICNGSCTNPTYLQYSKGINTIIIGQSIKSRKSNTGGKLCVGGALPYSFYKKSSHKPIRV